MPQYNHEQSQPFSALMSKPIDTIVSIPADVLAEVDLRLWDPLRNKIHYGSRSALIVGLLRNWLEKQEGVPTMDVEPPSDTEAANGH